MSNQIIVPALGESVTEATVSKWLKQVGESVVSDEPIVELETDKVNVEVPSPLNGTLSSIKVKEGDTVEVGALLGEVKQGKSTEPIDEIADTPETTEQPEISTEPIDEIADTPEITELPKIFSEPEKKINKEKIIKKNLKKNIINKQDKLNLVNDIKEEDNEPLVLDTLADQEAQKIQKERYIPPKTMTKLSPAVRKIVEENNIDISKVEGTGKSGRIAKGDLLNLMGNTPQPLKRKVTHGPEEHVKMTRLRATIAKRLKKAQDNAAMLTTFNEVDMQNIMDMKQNYKEDFKKKYEVKLGFMSFFVKASVVALKNFPAVNAEIDGDNIIYKNYYNISIAIGTDRGLVVPVLKKSDELSFADIERNIFALSEKARLGKITINDLQGGTFTISNGGIYGSMLSTPILNPPQTGILGMHNIVERPVVKDGEIVIRPIMYLALSYDHRLIDGKEAVSFLKTIKECLEEPRRLFLDL